MGSLKLSDEGAPSRDVLGLDDPASSDPSLVGAKAAALARARRAGIPVLDGFVISTRATWHWQQDSVPAAAVHELRVAWARLSVGGRSPVVVRSSSPHEDTETSSMAGQFLSVLDVSTWDDVLVAVGDVVDSADGAPVAVLVQPFIQPAWGGVLFGADPVTGRHDRLVVAAVPGGPHRLVSGIVSGSQFSLSIRGRVLDTSGAVPGRLLVRSVRRALAKLARSAAAVFGGPQDIEWAIEHDGRLVLLQSRPITAVGHEAEASGPVLGPGPVAETFPGALSALEEDLWIPPLRDGLRTALGLIGAVSARKLRASPLVVTVGGRPAVDLELLGLSPLPRPRLALLDPRPPARRLVAAWRVGRLRAALPALAGDLLDEVDAQLRAVPPLGTLPPLEQLRVLERSAGVLRSLHGYEVLTGQLLAADTTAPTAASRALALLAELRAGDPESSDETLVAHHPVLLSLVPPVVGTPVTLPPAPPLPTGGRSAPDAGATLADSAATRREALRLRIRWIHELTARLVMAVGHELVRRGVLEDAAAIRHLRLDEVHQALAGRLREMVVPDTPAMGPEPAVRPDSLAASGPIGPLPRAFRQAGEVIVPVTTGDDGGNGRGAGGGRGMGRVHVYTGEGPPPQGAVLVVATLDPSLASHLPGLSGLVAETGSTLSHLAILAREYGVPTVVDMPGARERFAEGGWVVVDGSSGEVSAVESEEWRAA
ncbi:MAG: PEP/pyruvate-binding domain-containing protein [Acidimicrobiales bacterium]